MKPIALSSAAQAQMSFTVERGSPAPAGLQGPSRDLGSSPVTEPEFETYLDILQLDDATASVAKDMYEGFRTEVAELNANFRQEMSDLVAEIQKTGDHSAFIEKMGPLRKARNSGLESLRDTFLGDLKLLLSEEQIARWPLIDQSRRRTRIQSDLNVHGANVDLIALTNSTLDNVPGTVSEKLDTYARNLDRMLLDYVETRDKQREGLQFRMDIDEEQQEKMRDLSDKLREISIDIRSLNDRTLRLVTTELNAEESEELTNAFKLAAFPQVYTPSYTDNALESALRMGSLDDTQRDQIRSLAGAHSRTAGNLNTRWERAVRESQEEPGSGMFFSGPGGEAIEIVVEMDIEGEEREPSDVEKAIAARTEHDEKTLARLRELLNETQLAELPPEPKEFDPFDPANLPEGANAVFISTIESDGSETVTDVQVLTPAGDDIEHSLDASSAGRAKEPGANGHAQANGTTQPLEQPPETDREATRLISADDAMRLRAVPVRKDNGRLLVAMFDTRDDQAADELSVVSGLPVSRLALTEQAFKDLLESTYGTTAADIASRLAKPDDEGADLGANLEAIDAEALHRMAEQPTLINLVNLIILEAVRSRASDIHVEPFEKELRVKYRIDGVLIEQSPPPKNLQPAITSRIKIMAGMNIAERYVPQDGHITLRFEGRKIDIRVSTVPTIYGESVVMRVLDKESISLELSSLGMRESHRATMQRLIDLPHGMVLVTGPTGSGKTTTLYAALTKLYDPAKKIITIEDPVEYELNGVNQIPVNPKRGLLFATGLRSILRQDPD
ncbi:xpsE, partial [Symbiodinium necroappetens]